MGIRTVAEPLAFRQHVLGRAIELLAEHFVRAFHKGPVSRENVVGSAPEEQIEVPGEERVEALADSLIKILRQPPTEREAASRIFVGTAGRLHDSIQREKYSANDLSHDRVPYAAQVGAIIVNADTSTRLPP